MAKTQKQHLRALRQEEFRRLLSEQGHLQHVLELLEKIADPSEEMQLEMLNRFRYTIDTKLKLMNKYIPDLKATEITGDGGAPLSAEPLTPEQAAMISKALDEEC